MPSTAYNGWLLRRNMISIPTKNPILPLKKLRVLISTLICTMSWKERVVVVWKTQSSKRLRLYMKQWTKKEIRRKRRILRCFLLSSVLWTLLSSDTIPIQQTWPNKVYITSKAVCFLRLNTTISKLSFLQMTCFRFITKPKNFKKARLQESRQHYTLSLVCFTSAIMHNRSTIFFVTWPRTSQEVQSERERKDKGFQFEWKGYDREILV